MRSFFSMNDPMNDGRNGTSAPGGGTCPSCGAELAGPWCHQCGERRLDRDARGFRSLLREAFTAITDLDGRLWRTLRSLLLHPGQLSEEYLAGRRRAWIGPISLFLLINVAYFVSPPISDFNLSLDEQIRYQPWGYTAMSWVEARNHARGITMEAYARSYANESAHVAKSLILWHVPWIAAVLAIVGRRRFYFAEHFVVAIHGFSFVLVLALILQWIIRPLFLLVGHWTHIAWDGQQILRAISLFVLVLALVYWTRAARRVYAFGWPRSVLTSLAFALGFVIGHWTYRWIQFVVTYVVT
ncbi:MAG: DUF3667 domain-containing protein [Candidatus Eisenbacteria bacterium]